MMLWQFLLSQSQNLKINLSFILLDETKIWNQFMAYPTNSLVAQILLIKPFSNFTIRKFQIKHKFLYYGIKNRLCIQLFLLRNAEWFWGVEELNQERIYQVTLDMLTYHKHRTKEWQEWGRVEDFILTLVKMITKEVKRSGICWVKSWLRSKKWSIGW